MVAHALCCSGTVSAHTTPSHATPVAVFCVSASKELGLQVASSWESWLGWGAGQEGQAAGRVAGEE